MDGGIDVTYSISLSRAPAGFCPIHLYTANKLKANRLTPRGRTRHSSLVCLASWHFDHNTVTTMCMAASGTNRPERAPHARWSKLCISGTDRFLQASATSGGSVDPPNEPAVSSNRAKSPCSVFGIPLNFSKAMQVSLLTSCMFYVGGSFHSMREHTERGIWICFQRIVEKRHRILLHVARS